MRQILQNATKDTSPKCCNLRDACCSVIFYDEGMNKKRDLNPPNHLKAWREFRHMTQEQLAEAIETTAGVISLLETRQRALSPKWLLRLAPVLRTTPGHLLQHDPESLDSQILEVWAEIGDQEDKERAIDILRAFTKKASVRR